jgi:hypothetical protein
MPFWAQRFNTIWDQLSNEELETICKDDFCTEGVGGWEEKVQGQICHWVWSEVLQDPKSDWSCAHLSLPELSTWLGSRAGKLCTCTHPCLPVFFHSLLNRYDWAVLLAQPHGHKFRFWPKELTGQGAALLKKEWDHGQQPGSLFHCWVLLMVTDDDVANIYGSRGNVVTLSHSHLFQRLLKYMLSAHALEPLCSPQPPPLTLLFRDAPSHPCFLWWLDRHAVAHLWWCFLSLYDRILQVMFLQFIHVDGWDSNSFQLVNCVVLNNYTTAHLFIVLLMDI